MKIYLPLDNINDFKCYEVRDKDTIRAYYSQPRLNSTSDYEDFYINSHYLEKHGTVTWSQYATLPSCLPTESITNDFYYRNDFSDILIIFIVIFIIGFGIPWKILLRLFRRFN